MSVVKRVWTLMLGAALLTGGGWAQKRKAPDAKVGDAKQLVQEAVAAELAADRDDHSHWRYRDVRKDEDRGTYLVVETEYGALKRQIEEDGKPLSASEEQAQDAYVQKFLRDRTLQQKQRKDGEHDEKDAEELLNLLPQAFLWTVESETGENITLSFRPDPNFHPPDMESRVMGEMSGNLIIERTQHRIRTMKGTLSEDVTIGYGILGRLKQGGTFDVERREIAPGLWQITETHVHISGRALLFKTIGQQQEEVKSKFTLVPPGTTLEQAVELLK